jgi:hypothetical protein
MNQTEAIDKLRRRLQTLRASISMAEPELGVAWIGMIDRTLGATESIDPVAPSLTPELTQLLTTALEAAVDCTNEVAQATHTTYAGYKQHRHDAVDADVLAVTTALSALKAAASAGKA